MSTIGISPDSVSATAAFVKEKDIGLPLLSDPSMSLIKAMGFVPAKGRVQQSAFIVSKDRVLLGRTTGKVEKIIDDLNRVLDGIMEEMEYESPE
jgi:peroxiredoxin